MRNKPYWMGGGLEMGLLRVALFWLCLVSPFTVLEAQAKETRETPAPRKSHALVIGIDHYECTSWRTLQYAKADARSMVALLRSQGFEVTPLYDGQAHRAAILDAFETLAARVQEGDRFVFFFAGHGSSRLYSGRKWGFVVPSNCGTPSNFISMQELRDWAQRLGRAHHQLFILDACFSGSFGEVRGVRLAGPRGRSYVNDLMRFPARQYITAGTGDQQVLDTGEAGHSLFTGKLLKALKDGRADANGDGFVTFNELGVHLEAAAWNIGQTPTFGTLPGHEGGSFLFPLPGNSLPNPFHAPRPSGRNPRREESEEARLESPEDLPDPIAYDPVQLKAGTSKTLPGGLGDASVSFGRHGETDFATLIVSPRQGKSIRAAILGAGSTTSFNHARYRYEITVLSVSWSSKELTFTLRGPLPGGSP